MKSVFRLLIDSYWRGISKSSWKVVNENYIVTRVIVSDTATRVLGRARCDAATARLRAVRTALIACAISVVHKAERRILLPIRWQARARLAVLTQIGRVQLLLLLLLECFFAQFALYLFSINTHMIKNVYYVMLDNTFKLTL